MSAALAHRKFEDEVSKHIRDTFDLKKSDFQVTSRSHGGGKATLTVTFKKGKMPTKGVSDSLTKMAKDRFNTVC
jgi:translation initiation factor 6 (eIF-6)